MPVFFKTKNTNTVVYRFSSVRIQMSSTLTKIPLNTQLKKNLNFSIHVAPEEGMQERERPKKKG
jgi:hypothetical protein